MNESPKDPNKNQHTILLDAQEVARRVGVSTSALAVDRHRRRGLPFIRLGRRIRYLESEVESYIAALVSARGNTETA